jgi:hypothetical protein
VLNQLYCEIPPTLNQQIDSARDHWSISANSKRKWTGKVCAEARLQGLQHFPSKVWLAFHWQVKSRGSDPDNISAAAKHIMDGLVDAGVLTKDSLMVIQSPVVHEFSKGDGMVLVTISDRPIFEIKSLIEEEKLTASLAPL